MQNTRILQQYLYLPFFPQGPLAQRSGYLKRQLDESSEITLSPPLNITEDTFTLVADYCYGINVVITPFNVVSLRVASELLEMTDIDGDDEESLGQMAEAYFRRAISLSREYALIGFRACLLLLPEAETTASLASRCVEALSKFDDVDDDFLSCVEEVGEVPPDDFEMLVESVRDRLSGSHDLLYRIVDIYLKVNTSISPVSVYFTLLIFLMKNSFYGQLSKFFYQIIRSKLKVISNR